MDLHELTLRVPEAVYEQIRRAAEKSRRPLEDVLQEAIRAVAPGAGETPPATRSAIAQMAYLNDAALWQAARATMHPDQRARLEALHDAQQRAPLSPEEKGEEEALVALYRDTLLVRAQAAVLLRHRGYDVSNPDVFQPLA
jgi:hypothetical protein